MSSFKEKASKIDFSSLPTTFDPSAIPKMPITGPGQAMQYALLKQQRLELLTRLAELDSEIKKFTWLENLAVAAATEREDVNVCVEELEAAVARLKNLIRSK